MIPLLTMLACIDNNVHEGVLVGNPGEAEVKTASIDAGTLRAGTATLSAATLSDCAGAEPQVIAEEVSIDLLGGTLLSVPGGTWCSLSLAFDGPLQWTLDTATRTGIAVSLDVSEVTLRSSGFTIDGQALLLELGTEGWLTVDDVPETGDIVDAPLLLAALTDSSALYVDTDRDGVISSADRLVADPEGVTLDDTGAAEASSDGGGCGREFEIAPADTGAMLLFVGLLGWRRRQRSAPHLSR